jgi:hypothetical protein
MSAVPVSGDSLCNNEVFIVDTGPIVYQWDGETAGIFLKNKVIIIVIMRMFSYYYIILLY